MYIKSCGILSTVRGHFRVIFSCGRVVISTILTSSSVVCFCFFCAEPERRNEFSFLPVLQNATANCHLKKGTHISGSPGMFCPQRQEWQRTSRIENHAAYLWRGSRDAFSGNSGSTDNPDVTFCCHKGPKPHCKHIRIFVRAGGEKTMDLQDNNASK